MSDDQKLIELCDELRLLAAHLTGDDFDRRPWAANRAAHVIEAQARRIACLEDEVTEDNRIIAQHESTIAELRAELEECRSTWPRLVPIDEDEMETW